MMRIRLGSGTCGCFDLGTFLYRSPLEIHGLRLRASACHSLGQLRCATPQHLSVSSSIQSPHSWMPVLCTGVKSFQQGVCGTEPTHLVSWQSIRTSPMPDWPFCLLKTTPIASVFIQIKLPKSHVLKQVFICLINVFNL